MSPKYFLASERLNWNRSQLAWAGQKLALQLLAQKLFAQSSAMGKTAGNKELKRGLEVVSGQWLLLRGAEVCYHGHAFFFFFFTHFGVRLMQNTTCRGLKGPAWDQLPNQHDKLHLTVR